MELRKGQVSDVSEIVPIFEDARRTLTFLPELHTTEETVEYFRTLLLEQESVVAIANDEVVGFAVFQDGSLNHLYVRRRRRGIGTLLLDYVCDRSPEGVSVWTFQENQDARRFYERRGFAPVEMTDGRDNEERVPDVRYHWPKAL